MNAPIFRLFALFVVLFAVLVGFSSRWAVFGATQLRENPKNSRVIIEEQRIKRGVIRAAGGDVLAGSRALSGKRYERRYPTGSLFAQAVGYDSIRFGRGGLERHYNDRLTGRKDELAGIVDSLVERDPVGDDLQTTLVPRAQQVAYEGLGNRKGAVVALDVKTGAVRVLAGAPSYDPEKPTEGGFNLATQGLFPPGSTFKTVTAAAALDSGRYRPDSKVSGKNGKVISGRRLNNFGRQDFGEITLTDALTNSVNTVWAEVGVNLGGRTMAEYMERFGFGDLPPMDYPPEQMTPSGIFSGQRLISASRRSVDLGRLSIGQERLQVTPLQMAMVAAAVGNGGTLMAPRLVERVTDAEGRVVDRGGTEELSEVMSREAAGQLTQMMAQVVEEGSGTAAALEGARVAGKTGTAEVDGGAANQAWFIGFAPVERPKMAVAVTIERTQGQGGTVAAPLAKRVLGDLIG